MFNNKTTLDMALLHELGQMSPGDAKACHQVAGQNPEFAMRLAQVRLNDLHGNSPIAGLLGVELLPPSIKVAMPLLECRLVERETQLTLQSHQLGGNLSSAVTVSQLKTRNINAPVIMISVADLTAPLKFGDCTDQLRAISHLTPEQLLVITDEPTLRGPTSLSLQGVFGAWGRESGMQTATPFFTFDDYRVAAEVLKLYESDKHVRTLGFLVRTMAESYRFRTTSFDLPGYIEWAASTWGPNVTRPELYSAVAETMLVSPNDPKIKAIEDAHQRLQSKGAVSYKKWDCIAKLIEEVRSSDPNISQALVIGSLLLEASIVKQPVPNLFKAVLHCAEHWAPHYNVGALHIALCEAWEYQRKHGNTDLDRVRNQVMESVRLLTHTTICDLLRQNQDNAILLVVCPATERLVRGALKAVGQ